MRCNSLKKKDLFPEVKDTCPPKDRRKSRLERDGVQSENEIYPLSDGQTGIARDGVL